MSQRKPTRKEKQEAHRKNAPHPAAVLHGNKAKGKIPFHGLLIALLGFLLYANSLQNDFVLDDVSAISKNWVVKQGISSFPTILTTSYRFGYRQSDDELYRPLPLMVFATLWQFFPGNPFPFHLLNVLLYALTGLVLFNLLNKLLKGYNPLLPFIAALIFMAHPLHTEVVANIKSMDEILSFLLVLLCMMQLLRFVQRERIKNLFFAWCFFFLAFLCKEGTVVMLAVIPLMLAMFTSATKVQHGKILLVLTSAAVIFILMRTNALGGLTVGKKFSIQENVLVSAPDPGIRLATVFDVMFIYIRLMLVPYPLSSDYSFRQLDLSSWGEMIPWLSLFFYSGIAFLAFRLIRTNKIVSFAIFFFLGTIALYSNLFMTIGALFAERFLYVPLLGFAIFVAWLFLRLFKLPVMVSENRPGNKIFQSGNRSVLIASALVLMPCGYLTVLRNADWKDTVSLFAKDVLSAPQSALLHYNYASELKVQRAAGETNTEIRNGILDSAIAHYHKALEIQPDYYEVFEQLGLAYYYRGMDSLAFSYVTRAIEAEPFRATAYNSLGTLYFEKAKDYQKALDLYLHAVQLNPDYFDGWRNVGATYGTLGQFDKSIEAFREALRLDPVNVTVLNFTAQTYRSMGDEVSAEVFARRAREAEKIKQ